MKKVSLVIILVLIAFLFIEGCKSKPYNALELKLVDSIVLNFPTVKGGTSNDFYYTNYIVNDSIEKLLFSSLLGEHITSFTHHIKSTSNVITVHEGLSQEFAKCNGSLLWKYINKDSIFLMNGNNLPYEILHLNEDGEIIDKWILDKLVNRTEPVFIKPNNMSTSHFEYSHSTKEFIFHIHNPFYSRESANRYNYKEKKISLTLLKDSFQVNHLFGKIPEINQGLFLGMNGEVSSSISGNVIVLSYNQSDSIQTYSKGRLLNSYYAGIKDFSPRTNSFDFEKANDRAYIKETSLAADDYSYITSNNSLILRICRRKKNIELKSNGTVKENNKIIPWSLVVLNSDFDYLGEVDLSHSLLDFNSVIPTWGNQLLIRSANQKNKFYRYEILLL